MYDYRIGDPALLITLDAASYLGENNACCDIPLRDIVTFPPKPPTTSYPPATLFEVHGSIDTIKVFSTNVNEVTSPVGSYVVIYEPSYKSNCHMLTPNVEYEVTIINDCLDASISIDINEDIFLDPPTISLSYMIWA